MLINTSRGRIVAEEALKAWLIANPDAAAAFDAFETEPPEDDELLQLPNMIAPPHIGAGSEEARWKMGTTAVESLTNNFIPEPGVFPFADR